MTTKVHGANDFLFSGSIVKEIDGGSCDSAINSYLLWQKTLDHHSINTTLRMMHSHGVTINKINKVDVFCT